MQVHHILLYKQNVPGNSPSRNFGSNFQQQTLLPTFFFLNLDTITATGAPTGVHPLSLLIGITILLHRQTTEITNINLVPLASVPTYLQKYPK